MTHRSVVVGAGFGGLCAAHALQAAGVRTTLLERRSAVGGKARNIVVGGRAVPAGPTVLTLREVFDGLFEQIGARLEDHVDLAPLEVMAHHRWSADEQLDLYQDVDRTAEAVAALAGQREADGYRSFVADSASVFETVEKPFIRAPKPDLMALARATGPFGAVKIKPFSTMWTAVSRHFRDPRLRQLFGRYATYCGSSPFMAPATLMLVAHVEQCGVWAVDGGAAALAHAIADSFERLGGTIATDAHVEEIAIKDGVAKGVVVNGTLMDADTVVVNADVAAFGAGLFGRQASRVANLVPPSARTLSAVTLCAVGRLSEPLPYHSVLFGPDYQGELNALFKDRRMRDAPSIYICAPDSPTSPDALQRVLMVMNAPADGDRRDYQEEDIARCMTQAMETLNRCGISLTLDQSVATTPTDFAAMLPATGGAIYGRASHGWTASFQRPAITTKVKGLYLAGGSVHPGPGMPMASLSGRMAAACLLKDFGLTPLSRPTVTSGGTLTESAKTVATR